MSIKPPVLDDDTWKIIDTSKVTRGEERRFTTGRVTFRQLLRPGSRSLSSIPSYVLSYFDPSDKKYHTSQNTHLSRSASPLLPKAALTRTAH